MEKRPYEVRTIHYIAVLPIGGGGLGEGVGEGEKL